MESEVERVTMSTGKRIWQVITAPSRAFGQIREDPSFLVPAAIILAISLAFTLLITYDTTKALMLQSGQSEEQFGLFMKFGVLSTIVSVLVFIPLVWLVKAIILLFYNQFSMGEANFKQLFTVAVYSGIPGVFNLILKSVLIKSIGLDASMRVSTNLGLLLVNSSDSFLFRFLSRVELFEIWGLILLIIGGATIIKKSIRNLGLYIFVLWLLLSLGIAALGGIFTPAGIS